MNRPRIATIVSAVAASTAAFVVTSRYHLGGTLAGAVLVPVIIILVSHTSAGGVDTLRAWIRRRQAEDHEDEEAEEGEVDATAYRAESRGFAHSQWWLAGLAGVAVAVSVYSLMAHDDPAVVRQMVIQRVTESTDQDPTVTTHGVSSGGGTATTSGGSETTTTTIPTDTTTTSATQPADTTTTSATDEGGGSTSTNTTQSSDTSLP